MDPTYTVDAWEDLYYGLDERFPEVTGENETPDSNGDGDECVPSADLLVGCECSSCIHDTLIL